MVSAIDYAKFIQVFDAKTPLLGKATRQWLGARHEVPTYAMGSFMRHTAHGTIYWHDGRVALRERGGGYSLKYDNGWTAVVLFDGDLHPDGYSDLLKHLTAALAKN